MNPDLVQIAYHPVESAIIRIALGLPLGNGSECLDLWNDAGLLPAGVVHLDGERTRLECREIRPAANNAVARLVLAGTEGQLPALYYQTGGSPRLKPRPTTWRGNVVRSLTISLFEICWYMRIEVLAEYEHYHLGWLPGFDRWVVTGSNNSGYAFGYFEEVLGSFNQCNDPIAAACEVIQSDWSRKLNEVGRTRWVAIVGRSRVSAGTVVAMADMVWRRNCQ